MAKIKINKEVFDATVSEAKQANNSVLKVKTIHPTVRQTNLRSLQQQLIVINQLEKIINQYYGLLDGDLQKLATTGQQLMEQDERLATLLKGQS